MRSMVKSYVRLAFKLIGDLAEDIIFVNSGASDFDYTTGTPIENTPKNHIFRAVKIEKTMSNGNINITKILLMTEQLTIANIPNIDVFDKVIIGEETLNIVHLPEASRQNKDNGYTTTIYASSEVA